MAVSYTLDAHSAAFVDSLVESGRYETAGDVVRESLRQMQAREAKLEALRGRSRRGWTAGRARSSTPRPWLRM